LIRLLDLGRSGWQVQSVAAARKPTIEVAERVARALGKKLSALIAEANAHTSPEPYPLNIVQPRLQYHRRPPNSLGALTPTEFALLKGQASIWRSGSGHARPR
jgi:hypothetical protein